MKKQITRIHVLAFAAVLLLDVTGNAVLAQGAGSTIELTNKVEVEVEVEENGKKVRQRMVPAKALPGDEVIYTLTYANKGAQPADAVVINNPVPGHTDYVGNSAWGDAMEITFSVDGGKTFAAPDQLKVRVRDESGNEVERTAKAEEYTHLRWTLKQALAPGGKGEVGFRARIE